MEPTELSNMRLKQVAVTNGLILLAMILFFIIINIFTVAFAHFFLAMAVLLLIQSVFGMLKGRSTKSLIPIFEKVAIYEKQKMGMEWYKQRKLSNVWTLVLSLLLFVQFYLSRDSSGMYFEIDIMFMLILIFFLLMMINISMIIHFRKVDRSISELELKGYTWKSNLVGVIVGIILGFIFLVITVSYIISGI
jgi:hypothetical protein